MQTVDVKEVAAGAADRSRSFISKQIDVQSTQLGDRLHATAGELRRIVDDLSQTGGLAASADLAGRGVDMLDRAGAYLQNSNGDVLLSDAEAFARKHPWTVAALALAGGVATARLMKSSSAQRYRAARDGDGYA